MKYDLSKVRLYNSFAYRFNILLKRYVKLNTVFKNLNIIIKLNNREFYIPLSNSLGAPNIELKEDWLFKLIKSLQLTENTDFLDIGVNVGQSLLTFRSCQNNTYWGFEPNPDCIYYLEQLIKVNHLNKVNVLPVGLSSSNSVVKLYVRYDADSAASIFTDLRPGFFKTARVKYIPVFAFDGLQLDIQDISLIKIDVEGAELEVIRGMLQAIKQHQPVIICEVLDYTAPESKDLEQGRATKLFGLLKELNYRVYRILHKNKSKLEFEELDSLVLKKWTPESFDLNDYLFLPHRVTALPG